MKIPEKVASKYRFIILAGQRVTQLQRGAKPRVEGLEAEKMTTIATEELFTEQLKFHKIGMAPPPAEPVVTEEMESAATADSEAPAAETVSADKE
jgi:DNA-directed RNA polymerase omega subunit